VLFRYAGMVTLMLSMACACAYIGGTPVWLKYPDKDIPDSGPIGMSWESAFGGSPYYRDAFVFSG
jgi:hypothetical protein